MADQPMQAAWVCPWGVCNERQAQACRSVKTHRGCGGIFPPGTTLEQAKKQIGPHDNGIRPAGSKT